MFAIYNDKELKERKNQILLNEKAIKNLKLERFGCLVWVFALFMFGVALKDSDGFFLKLIGFLLYASPIILLVSYILRMISNNKQIKSYEAYIINSTTEIEKYNKEKRETERIKNNTVFDHIISVAGTNYRPEAVESAISFIVRNSLNDEKYLGMSNKEIEEDGDKIYKYQGFQTNLFELDSEPDNEFDSEAIKVLVGKEHIGYIATSYNKEIFKYIEDKNYIFVGDIRIVGGPYKRFDFVKDKVVYNNDLAFGFRIRLQIINK